MAFFNEFPFTRTYDSDLAWLIRRMKEVLARMDSVEERMAALEQLVADFIATLNIEQAIKDALQVMVAEGVFDDLLTQLFNDYATTINQRIDAQDAAINNFITDFNNRLAQALSDLRDEMDAFENEIRAITANVVTKDLLTQAVSRKNGSNDKLTIYFADTIGGSTKITYEHSRYGYGIIYGLQAKSNFGTYTNSGTEVKHMNPILSSVSGAHSATPSQNINFDAFIKKLVGFAASSGVFLGNNNIAFTGNGSSLTNFFIASNAVPWYVAFGNANYSGLAITTKAENNVLLPDTGTSISFRMFVYGVTFDDVLTTLRELGVNI